MNLIIISILVLQCPAPLKHQFLLLLRNRLFLCSTLLDWSLIFRVILLKVIKSRQHKLIHTEVLQLPATTTKKTIKKDVFIFFRNPKDQKQP